MKKTVFIFVLIFIACGGLIAQDLRWVSQVSGPDGSEFALGIAGDATGNIYTTGSFSGTCDFDPSSGTFDLYGQGLFLDGYVSKLDASGNLVWAKRLGGSKDDQAEDIAVDSKGNIYVTGTFKDAVDFDPGAGTASLTANSSGAAFLLKLNAAGDFVWVKQFATSEGAFGRSVASDGAGNIYITGGFDGAGDFDPGAGNQQLSTVGIGHYYVVKMDTAGNFIWAKQGQSIGALGHSVSGSIVANANGVYISGAFGNTVDFDPGSGTHFDTTYSPGLEDMFICKLDPQGNFVWANSIGGKEREYPCLLSLDNSGNVYATGWFQDTVDMDPGAATTQFISKGLDDIFVSRFTAAGSLVWAKQIGGTENQEGQGIVVDGSGNVYVTGALSGTADFNPGAGVANLTSAGDMNIFVLKLDAAGNFVSVKQMPGNGIGYGNDIVLDFQGAVCITGMFMGSVDFDPAADTAYLYASGGFDGFVLKLDNVTGISEAQTDNTFGLYPNPTTGAVYITVGGNISDVAVYNMLGQLVTSYLPTQNQVACLDIEGPPGMYIAAVKSGEITVKTLKIFKQ